MNNKKYVKWEAKDKTVYNIKDMSVPYIRNCISMIVRSFNPEDNKNNEDVFDYDWTVKYGKKYIYAFLIELKSRRL